MYLYLLCDRPSAACRTAFCCGRWKSHFFLCHPHSPLFIFHHTAVLSESDKVNLTFSLTASTSYQQICVWNKTPVVYLSDGCRDRLLFQQFLYVDQNKRKWLAWCKKAMKHRWLSCHIGCVMNILAVSMPVAHCYFSYGHKFKKAIKITRLKHIHLTSV